MGIVYTEECGKEHGANGCRKSGSPIGVNAYGWALFRLPEMLRLLMMKLRGFSTGLVRDSICLKSLIVRSFLFLRLATTTTLPDVIFPPHCAPMSRLLALQADKMKKLTYQLRHT